MIPFDFNDLVMIRKGEPEMTLGTGATCVEPITAVQEWDAKAEALREIFWQTCGQRPQVDCPLDLRVESEEDRGDFLERRLSYALEPDERVTSIALIPKTLRALAPAVLCIHPSCDIGKLQTIGRDPMDAEPPELRDRAYGFQLVKRGFVVLAPDLLGAGERRYPGLRAFDNGPFYLKHPRWSGTGKDLWDLGRALDVIQQIPGVDPERIGALGHSQGGGLTTYLMAVDQRVKAGVNNCGLWPLRALKNPFAVARTGWWIGRPALRPFCLAGKAFPIDVHELMALAAPRRSLVMIALNDWGYQSTEEPISRPEWENLGNSVGKIYTLASAPAAFKLILHLNGHCFPQPLREQAYTFLEEALGNGGCA
jgi:dienelactone hydrolase